MDGNFYRGEIYNMRLDGGWGSEEAAMRPALIVSSDRGNESCPTLMCAMLTTQYKYGVINVETMATGRKSWIMCNQLRSFDKTRALKHLGTLNDEDMAAVEKGLMIAMSLSGEADESEIENLEAEISEKDAKIKELEAKIAAAEAEISEKDAALEERSAESVHNDMWKKLYEKALDELVSMKMTGDITRRMEEKAAPVKAVKVEAAPAKAEPVTEPESLKPEINTCTEADLKKIGVTPVAAHSIVVHRPYKSVDALRMVPYLTTATYTLIKNKVVCVPVVEEAVEKKPAETAKVNLNTASAKEISSTLGFAISTAYCITGYRNRNGAIKSLDELKNIKNVPGNFVEHYGDKITI